MDMDRIARDGIPFVCSDCGLQVQRCFRCREFGLEKDLLKCDMRCCGKFYHSSCLPEVQIQADANIICPLHSCTNCGENNQNSNKRSMLWRCFRCPKAYDLKHRPRDVHVLAAGIFLCIEHTVQKEIWPELPKSLEKCASRRKQVMCKNINRNRLQFTDVLVQANTVKEKAVRASEAIIEMKNTLQSIDTELVIIEDRNSLRHPMRVTKAAQRDNRSPRSVLGTQDKCDALNSSPKSASSFVIPKKGEIKRKNTSQQQNDYHAQKRVRESSSERLDTTHDPASLQSTVPLTAHQFNCNQVQETSSNPEKSIQPPEKMKPTDLMEMLRAHGMLPMKGPM